MLKMHNNYDKKRNNESMDKYIFLNKNASIKNYYYNVKSVTKKKWKNLKEKLLKNNLKQSWNLYKSKKSKNNSLNKKKLNKSSKSKVFSHRLANSNLKNKKIKNYKKINTDKFSNLDTNLISQIDFFKSSNFSKVNTKLNLSKNYYKKVNLNNKSERNFIKNKEKFYNQKIYEHKPINIIKSNIKYLNNQQLSDLSKIIKKQLNVKNKSNIADKSLKNNFLVQEEFKDLDETDQSLLLIRSKINKEYKN